MKLFKITIIGNSVALRTRPHQSNSKNYGQLLEAYLNENASDQLTLVQNLSFGRATLTDFKEIEADIIKQFPDLYILNIGVCDASTREVPFWYAEIMNRKKASILRALALGLHHYFFKKNRPKLVKLRGKKPWISAARFRKLYGELIHTIQHHTNGKVIVLSINQANERVEKELPGTSESFRQYNKIIRELAKEFQVVFLDLG